VARVGRRIGRLALIAGAVWLAAVAALLGFRHALIYPYHAGPAFAGTSIGVTGARAETIAAPDGTALRVWVVPPRDGRPVILHFTGNVGSVAASSGRLAAFADAGYGIAALTYRGAEGTEGSPREADLVADALALDDALDGLMGEPIARDRRVAHGISLGAALAVHLAARRPMAAVVLETPFARLCETAEHHYPLIPACAIMWDERWPSADLIAAVGAPVLILHGDADRIVPLDQARALHAAAAEPKRLVVYPGGGHNDLHRFGIDGDILAWLKATGL
jgi:fermentation-respiration switch protein FrsA (DUF1100 family)